ncbi:MAG TPA: hypothetical protein VFI31_00995 [Pirellulales bacterium]|nr:hypothetical protein [Pirellulales bacterium]
MALSEMFADRRIYQSRGVRERLVGLKAEPRPVNVWQTLPACGELGESPDDASSRLKECQEGLAASKRAGVDDVVLRAVAIAVDLFGFSPIIT